MSCIASLLDSISREVEKQLKLYLQGLAGVFLRGYLPQVWIFTTEIETVTFQVDGGGTVSATAGRAHSADVTIEASHAVLSAALRTRNRAMVPSGPFKATPHTAKGRAAFGYLRGQLGL